MTETLVAGPELDARVCRALHMPSFAVVPKDAAGAALEPIDFGYVRVSQNIESAWSALKALLGFRGVQLVHATEGPPPLMCQAFLVPTFGPLIWSARYPELPLAICDLVLQAAEKFDREVPQPSPVRRGDARELEEDELPVDRRSAAETRLRQARLGRVRDSLGRAD